MSSAAGKGFLAVITGLLVVVLAVSAYAAFAISTSSSSSSQLTVLEQNQSQLSSEIQALQSQLGTMRLQVGTIYNLTAGTAVFGGVPKPPAGDIAVRWVIGQYERLTGLNFTVYSVAPSATFWATISLKPGQTCGSDVVQQLLYNKNVTYCQSQLLGSPLPDNTLFIKPGQTMEVAFVVTSTATVNQQFAAVPHTYVPDQFQGFSVQTGVGEQCWCVAVNYPIAAGGTYIRVISIAVDSSVTPGTQVILNHVLYGPIGQA
ncbi:MAG: hypothetical protein KGI38_03795 [Thaumarchaeota archaeon]|nr:hypothetical protein [Nitrososphaerota archaeon]